MALNKYALYDEENELSLLKKVLLGVFVLFYPMLVSIYPILPPFIGLAGYVFIVNIQKRKIYAFSAIFYLINLDLNLTLPLFMSSSLIILIATFVYMPLKRLVSCQVCLLFFLVVIVDFVYYLTLFIYDFIFNTSSVIGDMLLAYYIVMDILIGMAI